MQRLLRTAAALLFCAFMFSTLACAQGNGPTAHSVVLNFIQSTTTGLTGNCLYRGTAAGTYTTPSLGCSSTPVTTFTDSAVISGTTYHYAVTAYINNGGVIEEGGYSNDVAATIPTSPNAPTGLGTKTVAMTEPPKPDAHEDELAEMLYLIRSEPSMDPADQAETVATLRVVSVQ